MARLSCLRVSCQCLLEEVTVFTDDGLVELPRLASAADRDVGKETRRQKPIKFSLDELYFLVDDLSVLSVVLILRIQKARHHDVLRMGRFGAKPIDFEESRSVSV